KAFLLWAVLPIEAHVCIQERTQSPVSRAGAVIFSMKNSQRLAFTCRNRAKKPVIPTILYLYPGLFRSIHNYLNGAVVGCTNQETFPLGRPQTDDTPPGADPGV
ncbi:hypothetical protein, partial [Aeromonas sobria]|uniref:hypothetical protein n=1 Tax=Aeromonas sobria TaxID=646 RepID=UPI00195FF45A